jgi:hypothetical protein
MEELHRVLLNSKAKLEKDLKAVVKMLKTLGVHTKGETRKVSAATRKKMAKAKKAYWAAKKKAANA